MEVLRRCVSLFAVVMVMLVLTGVAAAGEDCLRIVKVDGEAEVPGQPISASMTITVQYIDKDAMIATNEVAKRIEALKAALLQVGVSAEAVQTKDLSISTNIDSRTSTDTGHTAKHSLSVVVADAKRVGVVFDAAVAAGASSIQSFEYIIAEEQKLQEQAMRLAVLDARRKAGVLLGLAPEDLTILHVEDTTPPHLRATFGSGWFGVASTPMPISTEIIMHNIPVQASVSVEFTF